MVSVQSPWRIVHVHVQFVTNFHDISIAWFMFQGKKIRVFVQNRKNFRR